MYKKLFYVLFLGLFLVGCSSPANAQTSSTATATAVATQVVAQTSSSVPTAVAVSNPVEVVTATPAAPDLTLIGLPSQEGGETVFDFVATLCDAQWFTRGQNLDCPASQDQSSLGYVTRLDSKSQGLPVDASVLLAYTPQSKYETISSKYPTFTVQKGDRFQAVLTCRNHSFCDVEFVLDYFNAQGVHVGYKNWRYIFTDEPLVIDYPLDSIAGETVQFDLAVRARGNTADAYAVWIAPHIYRPR